MSYKKILGPLLIIIIALFPIVLWLAGGGTGDVLAKVTALGALALLSFNIILSARLPVFDRLFLGLDRAYRAHRIIGGTVIILGMLHSALIVFKYSSISLLSGYELIKPNTDIPLMAGKFALAAMVFFVVISLYINIKYQWFITVQRLLGAMIFVAGYHALFVAGSDMRTNSLLFAYFVVLGGSAAGLYIYRSLMHKSVRRKLAYQVMSVEDKQDITTIWLKPLGKALAFYAGQFAFFQFQSKAVDEESHPFSLSSNSNDANLRIAVKNSGDYTARLSGIAAGDGVMVEGPYGQFSFSKQTDKRQVWVAGGIGITPFVSMAQSLPADYSVTLYYCTNSLDEAIFLDELNEIAATKPNLKIITVCTDQQQRITAKQIVDPAVGEYLLCAPPSMMHDLEEQLVKENVPRSSISYEDFALV